MDLSEFKASLANDAPPDVSLPLRALWHLGRNDWEASHELGQSDYSSVDAAWVHAHLHRVEGDLSNARYWYKRAGKDSSEAPLDQEWDAIASAFLS